MICLNRKLELGYNGKPSVQTKYLQFESRAMCTTLFGAKWQQHTDIKICNHVLDNSKHASICLLELNKAQLKLVNKFSFKLNDNNNER